MTPDKNITKRKFSIENNSVPRKVFIFIFNNFVIPSDTLHILNQDNIVISIFF